MRLIDADALEKDLLNSNLYRSYLPVEIIGIFVNYAPTIDAVEVVRCKDCKHFKRETENTGVCDGGFCHTPVHVAVIDFCYCNYGERRNNE